MLHTSGPPLNRSDLPSRNGPIFGVSAPVPFLLATGDSRHEGVKSIVTPFYQ